MSRQTVYRDAACRARNAIDAYYQLDNFVMRSRGGVRYHFVETCSCVPQQWEVKVGATGARVHVSMRGHGFYVWYFPDGFSHENGGPYPERYYRVIQDDLRRVGVRSEEFTSIAQRDVHLRRAIEAIDTWRSNEAAGIPNVGLARVSPIQMPQ